MSTTPERTSSPPPTSSSPSPTPKLKSRWSRVGTLVRRSSTAFSLPKRSESPTPSERERESPPVQTPENGSVRNSTSRPSSLRNVEISTSLSPPAKDDHVTPSPIAESPAREAAATEQPPVGPSPLAAGVITAEPEALQEAPTPEPTPAAEPESTPAEPEAAPQESAPETRSIREPAPSYTTTVESDQERQPADPPSIKVEDTEGEPSKTPAASIQRSISQTSAQRSVQAPSVKAPSVAPTTGTGEIATPTPRAPVPTTGAAADYFDLPNPHDPPVQPAASTDYAAQIWGGDAKKGVAAKRSQSSFASSVGWTKPSNAPGLPIPDPFADPQNAGPSPVNTIHVPEAMDPRSPHEAQYDPIISMPLPGMHDLQNQTVRQMVSGYSLSGKSTNGPGDPSAAPTDERIPLLAGQNKGFFEQGSSGNGNGVVVVPRFQAFGWVEYSLPDSSALYYVHPTQRVITDIDLRNIKQLEIVSSYLDRRPDEEGGWKVPQDCELWLRDATEGKRRECVPVRNWVDHTHRVVGFEMPHERETMRHHGDEDDKLDSHYRYWSFMEAHPAHAQISPAAHAEASDALTWSYTDRLLPLARPVPPPFTQSECQELISVLRSFGAAPQPSGMQTIVHTRLVSRILLRVARWRQTHYRPHRALPHDAHKGHHHPEHKTSFFRLISDFFVGLICLGIPYLFVERSHHHRMDLESNTHSPAPVLVIGACACLSAAIILSATVTFMSFPGLDDISRAAGFIAILCSAASMTSSVVSLFRFKADMERAMWHYDMATSGMTLLTKRSVLMSLPLVFLAYAIAGFVTGIVIYSFRGVAIDPPGQSMPYEDYTKWIVVGTLGGVGGILMMSILLNRK